MFERAWAQVCAAPFETQTQTKAFVSENARRIRTQLGTDA